MKLSDAQKEFAVHASLLIQEINRRGWACTLGDCYRSPRAFGAMGEPGPYGRASSAHKQRLAIDLNLFNPSGEYIEDSAGHQQFGEYWESLHPQNRWGGRFTPSDGNHYSRLWGGIA